MKHKPTAEPRMSLKVALGILVMPKHGIATALEEGTSHPNAPPDVKPGEAENARAALKFADDWVMWREAENKRKAKSLRARARKLTGGMHP